MSNENHISLCVIVGNEAAHVVRFLDSFSVAFDELCLVRAIGNKTADKTVETAKEWCKNNGKAYQFSEYFNGGILPKNTKNIDDCDVSTWPHVDDFASARNKSFSLATSEWLLWADLDDVLSDGSASRIREAIRNYGNKYDVFCFSYELPSQNQSNVRERLFRNGHWSWSQPVHENCNHPEVSVVASDTACIFIHNPVDASEKDPRRNERILRYHTRYAMPFIWELHREFYFRWVNTKDEAARAHSIEYGKLALNWKTLADEMRISTLCTLAAIEPEPEDGCSHAQKCIDLFPWRREGYFRRAQREIDLGNYRHAVALLEASSIFRKPAASGYPIDSAPYGQPAFEMLLRACRLSGNNEKADVLKKKREEKFGVKISLLHATRGRPKKCLDARAIWMSTASKPETIEHIFAVDSDDKETLKATEGYERIIIENPNGCVKAWNEAARSCKGGILLQLSDDWLPCLQWDHFVTHAMESADGKPAVLQVSDGFRKDDLLCMAILNRARYEQQGHLFAPEYFGVFSDNEFSLRAFCDSVVLDGRHINFKHEHPVFAGKPVDDWDETHKRQNSPKRYAEGEEIFKARNAHLLK